MEEESASRGGVVAGVEGRLQRVLERGRRRWQPVTEGPWRGGNTFELLVDAEAFYPAALRAIDAARDYVLIEIYLLASGAAFEALAEALLAAARRGVSVLFLADQFGAGGLRAVDRDRLRRGGVVLCFYNPLRLGRLAAYLFRDHRKLLLIDGKHAFTGGFGVSDDYLQRPGRPAWHDVALAITGPVVADWQQLFCTAWERSGGRLPRALADTPAMAQGGVPGRVLWSQPAAPRAINRAVVALASASRERLWLATAYFIPSWRLMRALRRAARRGVDVRVLVPGPITDHPAVRHAGRRYYARLLRGGVRVFEYRPRFLHAKLLLGDDHVSLGSANFDRWNLRWNLEANQEARDPALAAAAHDFFVAGCADALEIDAATWRRRPLREKLLEWFFGVVERFLDRER